MEKLKILIIVMFLGLGAYSQTVPGYTTIRARYKWIGGGFDSVLVVPAYSTTPSGLRSQYARAGQLGYDSVNNKLYVYDGGWALVMDTANKWITFLYRKTASDSVFYVKGGTHTFAFKDSVGGGSYTFTNGLTESGGTVKWGGTLIENTDIDVNDHDLTFVSNGNNGTFAVTMEGQGTIGFTVINPGDASSSFTLTHDTAFLYLHKGLLVMDTVYRATNLTNKLVGLWDSTNRILQFIDVDSLGSGGGSSGVNIYNSDGTLSGTRVLDLSTYALAFSRSSINQFAAEDNLTTIGAPNNIRRFTVYNDSVTLTGSDQSASSEDSVLVRTASGRIMTRAQSAISGLTPTLQQVFDVQSNTAVFTSENQINANGFGFNISGGTFLQLNSDGYTEIHTIDSLSLGAVDGVHSTKIFIVPDSILFTPKLGVLNIDSLRSWSGISDTTYKKVMTWDTRNGRWEYSNWFGGSGSSDSSYLFFDTTYNRLGTVVSTDTSIVKSLRIQVNGSTVTPTTTDSTVSYNLTSLSLFPTTGTGTATGDVTGALAGNPLYITSTYYPSLSSGIFYNGGSGLITLGDYAPDHNETYVSIDDANRHIRLNSDGRLLMMGTDSISLTSSSIRFRTLSNFADTTDWKAVVINNTTGEIRRATYWPGGGGGSTDLSIGTRTATDLPLNSSTGADVSLPLATSTLAGIMSAADKARLDSNQYFEAGEGIDITQEDDSTLKFSMKYDTIALASFGAGAGLSSDTAAFQTTSIYGSFFHTGSDTLIITSMRGVLQGSSPDITYKVFFNDSINVEAGATALVTAGTNLTNTTTGGNVTSFNATKIPPGVWVWVKTPTLTTKPTYFSLTLIGYKKRVTP